MIVFLLFLNLSLQARIFLLQAWHLSLGRFCSSFSARCFFLLLLQVLIGIHKKILQIIDRFMNNSFLQLQHLSFFAQHQPIHQISYADIQHLSLPPEIGKCSRTYYLEVVARCMHQNASSSFWIWQYINSETALASFHNNVATVVPITKNLGIKWDHFWQSGNSTINLPRTTRYFLVKSLSMKIFDNYREDLPNLARKSCKARYQLQWHKHSSSIKDLLHRTSIACSHSIFLFFFFSFITRRFGRIFFDLDLNFLKYLPRSLEVGQKTIKLLPIHLEAIPFA